MKFKKTLIVLLVFILLFGIFLAIALPSVAKRGEDNNEAEVKQEIQQSILQAQPLGGALEGNVQIQPTGFWDALLGGIVGGVIGGALAAIPAVEQVYGTLHAGNVSTNVANGSYTNLAFGYTAPSGFPYIQERHESDDYNGYWQGNEMMWSNTNRNGWYYIRGYNQSTNKVTLESRICLDTVKPQIQVRYNGNTVPNGYTTNGSASFSLLGSDDRSGVETYWYKIGNGTYYQCYSSSTFSSDGVYTFYCKDRAGNISDTVTVTKDTVAPTLYMYNGSTSLSNGTYTNASTIRFEATDTTSGVNAIYIRQPNTSSFTKYSSSSVSLTAEGYYEFYAVDNAGLQSSTYSVTVDRTAPTMTVKSGSTTLSNNTFINTSSITATSNESGTCYVYKASTGTTITFLSGTAFIAEDTYKFHVIDTAGNKSSEITVTVDRTAPTYNLYAGGVLTTAAYTNAASIYYTASDANSFTVYVKEPSSSSYVATTNSKTFTAEGTYSFYAIDAAGNQSATRTITVDRTKPTISLYANTTAVNSGTYVNSENIYATASDSLSGVKTIYVKLPSGTSYTVYTSGTKLSEQGTYSFYCEDNAGNISDTKTIYLDKTAPVGTIYVSGSAVANDSYTNKSFSYTATDSLSGVAKLEIKKPNGNWETYTSGTSVTGVDGVYYFRATDVAGNVSLESRITLDTAAPVVQVLGDGVAKATNTFTNAASLQFYAFDSNLADCYIKVPNDTAFKIVSSGASYTAEGRYEFYATDKAGNKSETFVITIDKTKPVGTMSLTADGKTLANGDFANKAFKYAATDSLSGVSRLEIKKPNGAWEAYTSGTSVIGADGIYYFRAYDNAGNVSDESYLIYDTTAPIVTIYAGTAIKSDKSFTNAEYIKFVAEDTNLQNCYIKLPNETTFKATTSGVQFTAEGKYEFYAIDKAGNQSATHTITLDRTAPLGTLHVGGSIVTNNCHTNKAFSYTATDSLSGIARLEVKKPNGAWEAYISGTEIKSGDGIYYFRAIDNAGNVSDESYLIFDTTPPAVTIFAATEEKPDKSFTNAAYIKFLAEDVNSSTCYIKLPNESAFQLTTAGVQFTAEGRYEFYAVDKAGNQSAIFTITLDRTAPLGTITAGGVIRANGDYTNKAFSYTATDSLSGIARLEVKKPNGSWEAYTSGTEIKSGDGVYYFRTIDNAGNISTESFIYFSLNAPAVTLFAGANVVPSNAFTNADYIKFEANHIYLDTCYVKLPDTSVFQIVSSGAQFTASGRYEFYAIDKCGNKSETYVITLDKVKPVGNLFVGGSAAGNGTYTNKAFKYEVDGGLSGLAYCEIKRPNGTWERYTAGTLIGADSPNGAYYFRAVDNVGNVSNESVIYLDTVVPVGSLYADEVSIQSGSYTNALRIKFVCNDGTLASCYVKLPNSTIFEPTSSGALYSAVGRYEFYAVDLAGNVSETYVVIVDRTPKAVTVTNVGNNKTTQNVQLSWKDTAGSAPIVSVTVNGFSVANNAVIKTINGGRYEVVCIDSAGNIWTLTFTAERTDIETTTTNKYWYEAKDGKGNTYAFESYDKALAFAEQREKDLVKSLSWNSGTWDTGYIMDSLDARNAKQGTFYLYKKIDDPKVEVAYFTLERLNYVIRLYAEQDINKYYYWEKNPATSYTNNDLAAPVTNGKITAKSLTLRNDLTYKIDGIILSGTSYTTEGTHVLTVFDEFGNSYSYTLVIVRAAPDMQFRYGNGDYYSASSDQPYYLKNRITIKLVDYLDEFAMAIVKNSKGEILYTISLGDELILSEVGKYTVTTINHSGTRDYVFYISYDDPSVHSLNNTTTKRLEVNVTPSTDKDITLLSIKIYRSVNGVDWTLLDNDDYGLEIKISTLKYNFFKTGFYKVVVEDICRSGIDAVIYQTYFEKPAPVGSLNGVNGSGYSNGLVSFTWKDEAYAVLYKDGVEAEYISGTELTEEGSYMLIFRDYDGYEKEYAFTIDKAPATFTTTNEIKGGYVKENAITWDKEGVTATLYAGGVPAGAYVSGTKLTANGQYKIELIDLAGNVSTVEFIIDNVAPTVDLQGVVNNGQTKSSVKLLNLSKEAQVKAYLDGAEFDYKVGDTLSKVGTYRFVLTDAAGNVTEYNFEILYSLNASATIFIAIVIIALIGGVALVVIMRKKSKFKAKNRQK